MRAGDRAVSGIDPAELHGRLAAMNRHRALAFVLAIGASGIPGIAAITSPVVMQLELFGIPGESVDSKHPGTIDVQSFSSGVQQQAPSGAGGGAGKASLSNLSLTKWVDKSTPTLFVNCASGLHLAKATLYVRPTNSTNDMYKVILQDVIITSVSNTAAVGQERPTENLSLSYSRIQWFYQALDANGGLSGAAVVTGWDIVKNTKF